MQKVTLMIMRLALNMKLYFSFFLFFLHTGCAVKKHAPDYVEITKDLSVHKSRIDETTGCSIYLPISKNNGFTKAVIYFVYFEDGNYIARPSIDRKNCL